MLNLNESIPRYGNRPETIKAPKQTPAKGGSRALARAPQHKHDGAKGTLEKHFLDEFDKGRVALSVGTKGSGKSYTMLSYLRYCLENDIYDVYLLSLPAYKFEQHDSYDFIRKYKGDAKIIVFNRYDTMIFKKAVSMPNNLKKLILLDDSTGGFSWRADPVELQFLATIRHHNCSLWIVLHVLKSALPPTMRSMVDFIFLHLNTNKKAIESLYEEYLSIAFDSFKEFMSYYKENVLNVKYNSLLIDTRELGRFDAQTTSWNIVKNSK